MRHLHVSCDGINAVRGISFQVYADQIVTLIGANGAGKSTTLRAADVPEQMEGDGGVAGMELSAAQIAAIDCRAHALSIVACAGSGKTEVLARRVVRHLRQGVPAESIVAFTFTEKAAAELKTRIDERAGEADPQFTDRPPSGSGLFAGTIHSYCLRLLQEDLAGEQGLSEGRCGRVPREPHRGVRGRRGPEGLVGRRTGIRRDPRPVREVGKPNEAVLLRPYHLDCG